MDLIKCGLRIKQRREELGLSGSDLGKAVGVNKSTIFRYENGDFKNGKLPTIEAIANVLDVSPGWILCKTDDPTPIRKKKDMLDTNESKLINTFRTLNDLGQKSVLDYTDYLADKPEYKKETSAKSTG